MEKKKHKLRNTIIVVLAVIVFLLVIVPFVVGILAYESSFGRYETYEPLILTAEDFDGLVCESCTFMSKDNLKLAGYKLYNSQNGGSFSEAAAAAEAAVIIAHGMGGGGFNSYMNAADWFASHGYVVFGYDATGNDNSEGGSIGGLPQGIADLSAAIEYVEADPDMSSLPIVLFGHSWGAYSVSNVLNEHPEVSAAVSVSGWNTSADLIREQGADMVGEAAMSFILPYMMLYERIKFGDRSSYTAVNGFGNTDAGIMIIHSTDDDVFPIKYGYELYYDKFAGDPRFVFLKYEDKGHNYIYHSYDALEYVEAFNEQFFKDFGITDPENQKVDPTEKAEYIKEHIDKKRLNEVDEELFAQIDGFFKKYC